MCVGARAAATCLQLLVVASLGAGTTAMTGISRNAVASGGLGMSIGSLAKVVYLNTGRRRRRHAVHTWSACSMNLKE